MVVLCGVEGAGREEGRKEEEEEEEEEEKEEEAKETPYPPRAVEKRRNPVLES